MLEKMIRISRLYDCYGTLLTERQQKCVEMHYLQDLSLGEIAAELCVSRQAVNDILRRTEEAMEGYESRLQLLTRQQEQAKMLQALRQLLAEAIQAEHPFSERLSSAVAMIDQIYIYK